MENHQVIAFGEYNFAEGQSQIWEYATPGANQG